MINMVETTKIIPNQTVSTRDLGTKEDIIIAIIQDTATLLLVGIVHIITMDFTIREIIWEEKIITKNPIDSKEIKSILIKKVHNLASMETTKIKRISKTAILKVEKIKEDSLGIISIMIKINNIQETNINQTNRVGNNNHRPINNKAISNNQISINNLTNISNNIAEDRINFNTINNNNNSNLCISNIIKLTIKAIKMLILFQTKPNNSIKCHNKIKWLNNLSRLNNISMVAIILKCNINNFNIQIIKEINLNINNKFSIVSKHILLLSKHILNSSIMHNLQIMGNNINNNIMITFNNDKKY